MNEMKIVEPEIGDLQVSSSDMLGKATMLKVVDDASFQTGAGLLLEIKRRSKIVEERFEEPVSLAFKAHRAMTALRDSVLVPFKQGETLIKKEMGNYQTETDRKRREEAERFRKEAEAKAEADRIAKAEKQMDAGDLKGAEQTLETPTAPVAVQPVTPEAPKVAGVSFRDEARFEIIDANLVPRAYCVPDEKKIRGMVKALGVNANIPGVRVWTEKVVSAGSR